MVGLRAKVSPHSDFAFILIAMATAAWLNNKLGSAEWPHASSILDHLPDALKLWTSGDLDAMAKVRACVACAMMSKKRREEMSEILAELGSAARSDGDEWVKVIGNAVGDFDGTMNLKAVLEASVAVAESYDSIQALLSTEESEAPAAPFRLEGFSPLEYKFMHLELQEGQREEEEQPKPDEILHFKPRASQPPLDFTLSPAFVSALSGKKINKQAMLTSNLQPSTSIFIPVAISRSGRDGSGLLKAPSIDHSAAGTPRGVTDVMIRNMKRPRMDEPQTKAPPSNIESETI